MHQLILDKIDIKLFRSLKNIKLNFNNQYNEITGKNGTGKSSILDCIRFMISNYDVNFKKNNNFKTIENSNETKNPIVNLYLKFDNKLIKLSTENNNWYINDIKQNSRKQYLQSFYEKINVDENEFNKSFNPFFFDYWLSSERTNNVNSEIKNFIIEIANSLDKNNKIISPDEYTELLSTIEDLKQNKKNYLDEIKDKEKEKKWYIEHNNLNIIDINNLNLKKEKEENTKRLNDVENKINKYNEIDHLIKKEEINYSSNESKIFELQRKKERINGDNSSSNYYSNNASKKYTIFEWIILLFAFVLFVIPGILYKKYLNKKYNQKYSNHTNNSDYNYSQEIRNIDNDIDEIKSKQNEILKKIDEYKSNVYYKDVQIDELLNESYALKRLLGDNDDEQKIVKLKEFDKEINEKKIQLEKNENQLNIKELEKNEINKKTNKIVKKFFPNFDLSLFDDEKNDDSLMIKKDNIPLGYLNFSSRMNAIFELNDFLKYKRNLEVFFLIDGGESFNKIDSKNQILVAKVNEDSKLKFNGKDIY